MDQRAEEPKVEFNLDNRKLIVAFVVVMLVCAAFYVFGFVEGKRQGLKTALAEVSLAPAPSPAAPAPGDSKAPATEAALKPAEEKPVKEQLDWYKKVTKRGDLSAKELAAIEEKKPAGTAGARSSPAAVPASATGGYSVQIGAFKLKREAETKGASLKAKGYDYFIESPKPGNDLYLVKVGKFDSRAEAYALQQKLKKDGFSSFIKTN